MSRFAGDHLLVPILSRLIPRRALRVRRGAVDTGLRVLALLAVAPILLGLRAPARISRSDVAPVQVARAAISSPALHAAQTLRVAVDAHARTQSPVDAAPPSHGLVDALVALSRRNLATSAVTQPRNAVLARGYDATAPPVLS